MTSRTIVSGIDSSTQSCKAVTVDAETGDILSTASAAHPDGTAVDPRHWWKALQDCTPDGFADSAALAVSAQQHGLVALGADNRPVYDALLWNDTRSAPQAAQLRERYGDPWWAREIGVVPVSSFTLTKLAWLAQNEPAVAAATRTVLLPHDWLTWQLAGTKEAPTTDRSDASGTGYFSVPQNSYRPELIEEAFGSVPQLPRVLAPNETAGRTPAGTLLAAGCGDNAGAALGLGLRPGEVVVSIGTSGTVFTSTPKPVEDPSGAVAGFADATGQNLPLLATINAARILASTARLLTVDLPELDRLASAGPVDAAGLTLVPYFDGERTPNLPDARGTLLGMSRANLTPENLARSAVLGLLCSLADALDALRAQGIAADRVLLIGGVAKSGSVRAAAADILSAEIQVPEPAEYVALGAARQAAWALSGDAEPPQWKRRIQTSFEPTQSGWAADVRGRFKDAKERLYGV
ncbi:xylulokinase [Sinomonas cellulolyticus]|uniref:Xylulose kinase n=1 Tax=Sinomonas cellulolyticus TaxID=2801916 RepID=A0ABS1K5M0_9MICC|nr:MULTISPECIES: xylulokinase [Sinomonas]MBL0706940.1 xylulokinase [Sinomonas cellulolyticus]GHG59855.1 xylulokinase [Sinomonas sp. KCTC 49339]